MKKQNLILIALLISMFFISKPAKSNIMGSDLTWTCIGQDSFLVKLTLYRDCNGSSFGNVNVYIKCNTTNAMIDTLTLVTPTAIDITPTCNNSCSRCDSSSCTFPYGIEKYEYVGLLVFDTSLSCCNIRMYFQGCCRNTNITTGAAGKPFYTFAEFNRCLTTCDNSPQFTNPPIAIICIGQDFVFNHGVFDTDKDSLGRLSDSLVYLWGHPLSDSGNNIAYKGPYTFKKPIYFWSFPNANLPFPRGCHLDLHTGGIFFRSMKIEQTVMVTKVEEFRNGTLIGRVRRDIQVIVINCPNNRAPSLSGPFYKEVCAGTTVNFTINTNDYNSNDTLRISWNNTIPGATWTSNNGNTKHPSANLSWTPSTNMVSPIPYVFTVTVKDDACPVNGKATRSYQLLVKPVPKANISVVDSGCGNYGLFATPLLGSNPTYHWIGNFINGFAKTGYYMNFKYNGPGSYPYSMTMTAKNCQRVYFDTIEVDTFPLAILPNDTAICYGSNLTIPGTILYGHPNLEYYWSTADSNVMQTTTGHLYNNTTVSFTVKDTNGCEHTDKIKIKVHKLPTVKIIQGDRICTSDSVLLSMNYLLDKTNLSVINWWNIDDSILLGSGLTKMIYDSGAFSCQVIDDLGCIGYDTINVVVSKLRCAIGNYVEICEGDSAFINSVVTNPQGYVSYRWSSGDTASHIATKPIYQDEKIYLTVNDDNNCEYTDSLMIDVHNISLDIGKDMNICHPELKTIVPQYQLNRNEANPIIQWFKENDTVFHEISDILSVGTEGKYYCKLTDSIGCSLTDSLNVIVHYLTVYAGEDDTLCSHFGHIKLNGIPAGYSGVWYGKGLVKLNNNWYFNTKYKNISDGENVVLRYKFTDSNNCKNSDTLIYTVFLSDKKPEAGTYPPICENSNKIMLNGQPSGGYWTGKGIEYHTFFNPLITGAGNQKVFYTTGHKKCFQIDSAIIEVLPLPIIQINPSNNKFKMCKKEGLVFINHSPVGGTYGGYWSGNVGSGGYFNSNKAVGDYQIAWHFTDNNGCYNADTINLSVVEPIITIDKSKPLVCKNKYFQLNAQFENAQGLFWTKGNKNDGYFVGSQYLNSVEYKH
ncbi:MAG: hypothetical protein U9R42_05995, partial [Bacteroidota bacterium]|nr:hypothetical protein [Bacteroidota bacterium]